MFIIIILIFCIFLINILFFNNSKLIIKNKWLLALVMLGVSIFFIKNTLLYDGVKSVYCFSDDKCITVWKRKSGEIYIIVGKYKSKTEPSDNYVKITNMILDYLDVIFISDGKLIISLSDKVSIEKKSSNYLIEIYEDNKTLNDSLYTYYDNRYKKYKENIDFISINIKENYAITNTGEVIK